MIARCLRMPCDLISRFLSGAHLVVSIPEALDKGLRVIRGGLKAFVGEVINSPKDDGKTLLDEINAWRDENKRRPLDPDPGLWSPDTILSVIVNNFAPFEQRFVASFHEDDKRRAPYVIRGWLNDLILLRNKSEHQRGLFSNADADDFMRIAERLLITAGAPETGDLANLRTELNRQANQANTDLQESSTRRPRIVSQSPDIVKVRRIKSSKEPEFQQFLELMRKEFPPNVRDLDEDLERWLDKAEIYRKQTPPCDDIFLVATHADYNDIVVGLLYASYYRTLGFVFISYLAVDREFAKAAWNRGEYRQAISINQEVARQLLKRLDTLTNHNVHMVTEITTDDEIKNTELKRLFRKYAHEFGQRLYKMDLYYLQPALDPASTSTHGLLSEDLLYLPGPAHRELINGRLPKDKALEIVEFVYKQIYAGNFDEIEDGAKYREHVEDTFRLVCDGLPDPVPLIIV